MFFFLAVGVLRWTIPVALPAHTTLFPWVYEAKNGFWFQSFLVEFELPQQNDFRCVDFLRWPLFFTRWRDEYGCSCYGVNQMWETMSMAALYSENWHVCPSNVASPCTEVLLTVRLLASSNTRDVAVLAGRLCA